MNRWASAAGIRSPSASGPPMISLSRKKGSGPGLFDWDFADKSGNAWVLKNFRGGVLVRRPSRIVGAPLQLAAMNEEWIG